MNILVSRFVTGGVTSLSSRAAGAVPRCLCAEVGVRNVPDVLNCTHVLVSSLSQSSERGALRFISTF